MAQVKCLFCPVPADLACPSSYHPRDCYNAENNPAYRPLILERARRDGLPADAPRTPLDSTRGALKQSYADVLITGGAGDFLATEPYLTWEIRDGAGTVGIASTSEKWIRQILERWPIFPHVSQIESIPVVDGGAYLTAMQAASQANVQFKSSLEDLSIARVFDLIKSGYWRRGWSAIDDAPTVDSDEEVIIHPYSMRNLRDRRNFDERDWDFVLDFLAKNHQVGYVTGDDSEAIPFSSLLLDNRGVWNLADVIEKLKGARYFFGAASAVSVAAARYIKGENLYIKGSIPHLHRNRKIYYGDKPFYATLGGEAQPWISGGEWSLIFGGWGDALVAYADARRRFKKPKFVIYSLEPQIKYMIESQGDYECVELAPPESEYHRVHTMWYGGRTPTRDIREWGDHILGGMGITPQEIHLKDIFKENESLDYIHDIKLPGFMKIKNAARLEGAHLGDCVRRVLVHPYSLTTVSRESHWPHWSEAIEWVSQTKTQVVLTGKRRVDIHNENIINMTDTGLTMMDIYCLGEYCDFIVCTSTNLAIYSTMAMRSALVACNDTVRTPGYYFGRHMEHPMNEIVEHSDSLDVFKCKFNHFIAEPLRREKWTNYDADSGIAVSPDGQIALLVDGLYDPAVYDAAYHERYESYRGTETGDAIIAFRAALVAKYADGPFLDYGCGPPVLLDALPGPRCGYDVNPRTQEELKGRGYWFDPYETDCRSVRTLGVFDVLEHLPSPAALLNRFSPGTTLVLSIPIYRSFVNIKASKHYRPTEHLTYWTEPGITRYLADLGWEKIESTDEETRLGRESVLTIVAKKGTIARTFKPRTALGRRCCGG